MSDGYFENRKTVSPMKEEEKVEEAKSHRNQTRQILWIMRSKKYALFLLILANILLGLYFFASHFTDVSFIWYYIYFQIYMDKSFKSFKSNNSNESKRKVKDYNISFCSN